MPQSSANVFMQTLQTEIDKRMGGGQRKRVPKTAMMGTIDPGYSSGLPNVILDDDPSRTPIGPYPYMAWYAPAANDRVVMLQVGNSGKFVVIGKVIYQ